jgi:hypothetical protein
VNAAGGDLILRYPGHSYNRCRTTRPGCGRPTRMIDQMKRYVPLFAALFGFLILQPIAATLSGQTFP